MLKVATLKGQEKGPGENGGLRDKNDMLRAKVKQLETKVSI